MKLEFSCFMDHPVGHVKGSQYICKGCIKEVDIVNISLIDGQFSNGAGIQWVYIDRHKTIYIDDKQIISRLDRQMYKHLS